MHQAINRLNASGASMAQQGYGALAALTWLVEEKTGASLGATFLHEKMQHWQKRASGWGTLADLAQTDPITDFLTQLPAAAVSVRPPLVGGMAARGTASQILKRLPGWIMNESARKTAEKYIAGFIEKQGLEKIALFGGGIVGGVQSIGDKYSEVYAAHRQKGVPELEARQMAVEATDASAEAKRRALLPLDDLRKDAAADLINSLQPIRHIREVKEWFDAHPGTAEEQAAALAREQKGDVLAQAINRVNGAGAGIAQQGIGVLAAFTGMVKDSTGLSLGSDYLHEKMLYWQHRSAAWETLAQMGNTGVVGEAATKILGRAASTLPSLAGGVLLRAAVMKR